jgi:hypothetical protein
MRCGLFRVVVDYRLWSTSLLVVLPTNFRVFSESLSRYTGVNGTASIYVLYSHCRLSQLSSYSFNHHTDTRVFF